MKIKVKDQVLIITGKDKGKKGEVLKTSAKEQKVVVKGVNIRTKHIKKTKQAPGKIVKFEGPVHVSNVMLISPITNKPTRVGYKIDEKGKKYRICKKSNEKID